MAEALLRHRLAALGPSVSVRSSGTVGNGSPATPDAVAVLADRGLDLSSHQSRRLTVEQIAQADLVLAMTRQHVREVCVLDRDAAVKTFTLKDMVRRGSAAGPRRPDQTLADWLGGCGPRGSSIELLAEDPDDDVADPLGYDRSTYRDTAEEIDEQLDALVALVWPDAASRGAA
jgi:protein-tyrosine phosphatase